MITYDIMEEKLQCKLTIYDTKGNAHDRNMHLLLVIIKFYGTVTAILSENYT